MTYESLLDLVVKGGFTIYVLIICSILSLAVIVEKFFSYKGITQETTDAIKDKVKNYIENNKPNDVIQYCNNYSKKYFLFNVTSPLASVYKHITENYYLSKEELTDSAYNKLDIEMTKLEKGLGVLATLGSIAPFIGLFGTVVGIIKSFAALSINDTSNYTKVMAGISEALIATAAGLFVAVPAVLFYNYFMKKLKLSIPYFDEAINDVIRIIKREK